MYKTLNQRYKRRTTRKEMKKKKMKISSIDDAKLEGEINTSKIKAITNENFGIEKDLNKSIKKTSPNYEQNHKKKSITRNI